MYGLMVAGAGLVLFERLAQADGESRALWMGLLLAVIGLSWLLSLGVLGIFVGELLLLAAFTVKRLMRKEQGRGPVR